jgi:hypothetical protein
MVRLGLQFCSVQSAWLKRSDWGKMKVFLGMLLKIKGRRRSLQGFQNDPIDNKGLVIKNHADCQTAESGLVYFRRP